MKQRFEANSSSIEYTDPRSMLDGPSSNNADTELATRHTSRRDMIAATALGLGALVAAHTPVRASANGSTSTHQEIDLPASPSRVYGIFLDEKLFSAFTGRSAQIDSAPGGAFKLFQGHPPLLGVTGRNVELVPNKRIVQAWRAGEWDEGVYSIVRFELTEKDQGTRVIFDQIALVPVPGPTAWTTMYWNPLQKYLAS